MKEKKICAVCNEEFYVSNTHSGARGRSVRSKTSKTCSRKCARYFRNVTRHLSSIKK